MSVSNVGGSQQTRAPTFDVKEQNQRPLSQRRTPDTLGGKNASSSCSFRHCFTRIYDFFCALFRCLFCIKNKPKEPNTEEGEKTHKQTPSDSDEGIGGSACDLPKEPKKSPAAEAVDFFEPFKSGGMEALPAALITAKESFKAKSPEVQDVILRNITLYRFYDVLGEYLTEDCLGKERNRAFLEAYGAEKFSPEEAQQHFTKLTQIFRKGIGRTLPAAPATQLEPEAPKNTLTEAAGRFWTKYVSRHANMQETSLREESAKAAFRQLPRAVRSEVLESIRVSVNTMYGLYGVIHLSDIE